MVKKSDRVLTITEPDPFLYKSIVDKRICMYQFKGI